MRKLLAVGLPLVAAAAMAVAGKPQPAGPSLAGRWGGDRLNLTLAADGGILQMDCATGSIEGPLRLSGATGFTARGTFSNDGPGPSPGDTQAARATFHARRNGVDLLLEIRSAGGETQSFHLVRDRVQKLHRCL